MSMDLIVQHDVTGIKKKKKRGIGLSTMPS